MYHFLWTLAALQQQPTASPPVSPGIATVTVEPAEVAVQVGDTVRLFATA
jgi:plastocyanin